MAARGGARDMLGRAWKAKNARKVFDPVSKRVGAETEGRGSGTSTRLRVARRESPARHRTVARTIDVGTSEVSGSAGGVGAAAEGASPHRQPREEASFLTKSNGARIRTRGGKVERTSWQTGTGGFHTPALRDK